MPSPTSTPGRERPQLAMKVVTVVGNRPQFVKAAAVSHHLRARIDEVLVHSGQHYDRHLSAVFFEELGLPRPDRQLGVGSGSHAEQTGTTMARLEPVLQEERPDAALVYGDTNTTLAAALVAAKLFVPLLHLEAGMRSFDRAMPEEVNRIVADRLADLLLCATETAMANLAAVGLADRARLVGDPMVDIALQLGPIAERRSRIREQLGLTAGDYLLATLHRAANVDGPATLERAVSLLGAAAERYGPLVFPAHPRTRAALARNGLLSRLEAAPGLLLTEPLGYLDFVCLLRGARAVLTDSGGVQKEACVAAVPCLTLRTRTEWPETLEGGRNRLVGLDTGRRALPRSGELDRSRSRRGPDGARSTAAAKQESLCAEEMLAWLGGQRSSPEAQPASAAREHRRRPAIRTDGAEQGDAGRRGGVAGVGHPSRPRAPGDAPCAGSAGSRRRPRRSGLLATPRVAAGRRWPQPGTREEEPKLFSVR